MLRSLTCLLIVLVCNAASSSAWAEDCGATLDSSQLRLLERIADAEAQQPQDDGKADGAQLTLAANVVVLRRGAGATGDIPIAEINALLATTNASFKQNAAPFVITAQQIQFVDVDQSTYDLQRDSQQEELITKQYLRGGKSSLNIFVMGAGASSGGWSSLELVKNTGVFVLYDWDRRQFNAPTGLAHEIGHWLGLQHPFEWGCGGVMHGDLIRDTPTQAAASRVCGIADTCSDETGSDPTDNIMGYALDCRANFTPGQVRRMVNVWRWVRAGKGDEFLTDDVTDSEATPAAGCNSSATSHVGSVFAAGLIWVALLVGLRRRQHHAHDAAH